MNEIIIIIDNKNENYQALEINCDLKKNKLIENLENANKKELQYEIIENVPDNLRRILLKKYKEEIEEKQQIRKDIKDYFTACERSLESLERIYMENY